MVRWTWGRRALAVALVAGLGWAGTAVPASAHPGAGVDAVAHAEQDLAGVPVTEVERETRANAAAITKITGVRPGTWQAVRPEARIRAAERAADAGDAGVVGQWDPVVDTPLVPVFQAVLPDGKVLMWDSVGDGATESFPDQSFTRAIVWDPATKTSKDVRVNGYNIFCAGYTQLANGNVLVAGGNKDQALNGIVQTHVFDWRAQTWSRGPDMAAGRWYPSVAALANGEAVIVAGGPSTAEVYQTNGTLRRLTGFTSFGDRAYPFLVPRPDGQVQLVGPGTKMDTMATAGTGALTASQTRDGIYRDYGSFATYAVGKTLVAGGGNVTEDGQTQVPTRTAVVVDTNAGTSVTGTDPMTIRRRQFNLTVLADGSVLATGGETKATNGLVDLANAALAAERWDPATGRWTTLASASTVRQYHSTATLLPDGRVLTGGGGICGVCTTVGYLQKNLETFTPPYLYRRDGSGRLADRPVIGATAATVTPGTSFTIDTPQAGSITKVGLVRLGAPTHGVDQGQRYLPLSFRTGQGVVTADAPASTGTAPPGYYMLFITDSAGVPSVAKVVQVVAASTPPPSGAAITGLQGRCLTVRGGSTSNGTPLIMADCTDRPEQRWTASTTDGTLRSLDRCMTVNGWLWPGSRVVSSSCGVSSAQRWDRRSDGTIRPRSSGWLCLAVVGGSTAAGAAVEVQWCQSGAASQRWSWTG